MQNKIFLFFTSAFVLLMALAQARADQMFNPLLNQKLKCNNLNTGEVNFTSPIYRLTNEGTSNVAYQITLSQALTCDLKVAIEVYGSAVAGVDYSVIPSSITIPAGQTVYNGTYNLLTNNAGTSDKSMSINLAGTNLLKVTTGATAQIQQWIVDTDSAPYSGTEHYIEVSTGSDSGTGPHTCGILWNGRLKCWGENNYGEIGDGGPALYRATPVLIDEANSYRSIASGSLHTCGVTSVGDLKCWGYNGSSQLGDGSTTSIATPTIINSGVYYKKVVAGSRHTCAITSLGALQCWGRNNMGQAGTGSGLTETTPANVDILNSYVDISAGGSHTCGLTTTGALYCWGYNGSGSTVYGNLGNGNYTDQPLPVLIDGGTSYKKIAGGTSHTCGITSADVLKCWGRNTIGQLGIGSSSATGYNTPQVVDSGVAYANVAVGTDFACAITTAGVLKCWGNNANSQLGDNTTTVAMSPLVIDAGTTYESVSLGTSTTCATTTHRILKCWGHNGFYQVGNGTTTTQTTPLTIDPRSHNFVQSVSVSRGYSSPVACVITAANTIRCWGNYPGDGTTFASVPVEIDATTKYLMAQASEGNMGGTCALTDEGFVKCWGTSYTGGVGDGTQNTTLVPKAIDIGVKYRSVSGYMWHNCGITVNDELKCWGYNDDGQIGDGTTNWVFSPTVIDPGVSYASVSVGFRHTCAVTTTGVAKCWGSSASGQLGDGTLIDRHAPVVADSGTRYRSINTQQEELRTCGLTIDGSLRCWGTSFGYWGDDIPPTTFDAGTYYKEFRFPCGLMLNDQIRCIEWGAASPFGTDTFTNALYNTYISKTDGALKIYRPMPTEGLSSPNFFQFPTSGVKYVSVGAARCYITTDNVLKCSGGQAYNYGNFPSGDGTFNQRTVAMRIQSNAGFDQVSGSLLHTCAIAISGDVYCWGSNNFGQIGNGSGVDEPTPVLINDPGVSYTKISSSFYPPTTCGLTTSGVAKCWGNNDGGKIGNGNGTPQPTPQIVNGGTLYKDISVGAEFACGVTTGSVLQCWGNGGGGQLGNGANTDSLTPVIVDPGVSYDKVEVSNATACGITTAGDLKCWGSPQSSSLGDNTYNPSNVPIHVDVGEHYKIISVSTLVRCGITTSDELKCWGYGGYSGVGNGDNETKVPTLVDPGVSYKQISANGASCGVTTSNFMKCTNGGDDTGNLGRGGFFNMFVYIPNLMHH